MIDAYADALLRTFASLAPLTSSSLSTSPKSNRIRSPSSRVSAVMSYVTEFEIAKMIRKKNCEESV
jgi:hypothetical protein